MSSFDNNSNRYIVLYCEKYELTALYSTNNRNKIITFNKIKKVPCYCIHTTMLKTFHTHYNYTHMQQVLMHPPHPLHSLE